MIRKISTAALIALVAAPCIVAESALAGSPYYTDQFREPPRADPNPHGIPDVPNLQGCVPLCERDLNPCDPPIYKQTDGRCNFIH